MHLIMDFSLSTSGCSNSASFDLSMQDRNLVLNMDLYQVLMQAEGKGILLV